METYKNLCVALDSLDDAALALRKGAYRSECSLARLRTAATALRSAFRAQKQRPERIRESLRELRAAANNNVAALAEWHKSDGTVTSFQTALERAEEFCLGAE